MSKLHSVCEAATEQHVRELEKSAPEVDTGGLAADQRRKRLLHAASQVAKSLTTLPDAD